MFRLIVTILAVMLCLPAAETAKPDARTAALAIPSGALVRIKTSSKQTFEGKLTGMTAEGVRLMVLDNDRIAEREVPFSEIKSIQERNKPMSAGKGILIALGVIYGLIMLVSGIAIAVS
jgi:hypothetical protein